MSNLHPDLQKIAKASVDSTFNTAELLHFQRKCKGHEFVHVVLSNALGKQRVIIYCKWCGLIGHPQDSMIICD